MAIINYLTTIEIDSGVISLLPRALLDAGIRRPLFVTDHGIVKAGLMDRVMRHLEAIDSPVLFADTPPNPTESAVESATEMYKSHVCDGIVAVGGGSPLDLAKGVAVLATHPGPLARYAGWASMPLIGPQCAPIVAIPTTSGTGSEVARGALICLHDGRKLVIVSRYLLPKVALCDPDMTIGLPALLTAGTGMDALTHCIETFLSPRINPPADAIALDGAARAWKWLEKAVHEPTDRQARWEMMMAGIQGGLSFQKGLGAVHAIAHPLGALTEPSLHHGTVNAVLLPHVLQFNESHAKEKYVRLRQAFGLSQSADLGEAVAVLNKRIGMPASLSVMGVSAVVADDISDAALTDHTTATNARPISRDELKALFLQALH